MESRWERMCDNLKHLYDDPSKKIGPNLSALLSVIDDEFIRLETKLMEEIKYATYKGDS